MQDVVYLNGEFIQRSKAYIHVDDRGFYFGDGVYEVVKYYKGKPFRPGDHMDRLRKSLSAVKISRVNIDALEFISNKLIYLNDMHNLHSAVYIQITRGVAPRSHRLPDAGIIPTIYASAFLMPFPENDAVKGISVSTTEDIRWKRCDIKAITLLPNTLTFEEATKERL